MFRMGIDAGSTTVKVVLLDSVGSIRFMEYRRHHAAIVETAKELVSKALIGCQNVSIACGVTGSAGIALSRRLGLPFVQEVVATTATVKRFAPSTDVFIELGGEDAKISFFDENPEQRMNGTCAGGTGSFIDQMADLLLTDAQGLDGLAKGATTIYPIASRCGVFAKTDVQPLLNEGASREDIAASVFQAVVNQTIGGLACGHPISGVVAFLGGPLAYLPQLRQRFIETLKLPVGSIADIPHPHLAPAMGAALSAMENDALEIAELSERLARLAHFGDAEVPRLARLFASVEERGRFLERHRAADLARVPLAEHVGPCWLGIDAGSTTTKMVLIDENRRLLASRYAPNQGRPLESAVAMLKEILERMPEEASIAGSVVTGYGEALLKAGLSVDGGEIETIAHCRAAEHFLPGVERIIDIGGQDMKCIRLKGGTIDEILLNEACSSGCGSFIENAAHALDLSVEEFAKAAVEAENPVDLGSRCTVFMNSRIKQAQKDGARVSDISAGLSYAVVRNALYKVMRLRNAKELGERVVVQGGTFLNDGILRCFELEIGREVVRPVDAGCMGALGAALLAKERFGPGHRSALLKRKELDNFRHTTRTDRCGKCANRCLLTRSGFSTGQDLVSGNRCDKGACQPDPHARLPDMFAWKHERLFRYRPLEAHAARRGTIGIPRVLNVYEHYPYWFTLLTELGFRVQLSPRSSRKIYESGLDTIPSESICFPAKLAHGQVRSLVGAGVKTIFHPNLPYERKESGADNHFSCPVAGNYPELLRNNLSEIVDGSVEFLAPFLPIDDPRRMARRVFEELGRFGVGRGEAGRAVVAAETEAAAVRDEIRRKGEEVLAGIIASGGRGVVLAGRPYHVDPEIHHGVPDLVRRHGFAVLTEDAVAHLGDPGKLRVVDQWSYHSRLYRAADFVAKRPELEFVQLASFGCGLDAVVSDQVQEILARGGKLHSLIKIDEGANLGAARIRIRSMAAATERRDQKTSVIDRVAVDRPLFTKAMRKTHTILTHQVSPMHYQFVEAAFNHSGYRFEVLPSLDRSAAETGLRYVHHDACFPSIVTVGQLLRALESGKYDLDSTAVIMVQSGGGCRMTNYIAFLKKALKDAGLATVPVLSFNMAGLEKQPGFGFSPRVINRLLMGLVYGDTLMKVVRRTRPYESVPGTVDACLLRWEAVCKASLESADFRRFAHVVRSIVEEFDSIPVSFHEKPKVGMAGEILVKYHPTVNNDLVEMLEREGVEVVVPNLVDWILYCAFDADFQHRELSASLLKRLAGNTVVALIERYRSPLREALRHSRRFTQVSTIRELARHAKPILSLGNQSGEGWYLTAEMLEMIHNGAHNIVCMQPFGCLPNHIVGKGMHKEILRRHPHANIVSIDYDPGASEVNQLNRLKLMLSRATSPVAAQASGKPSSGVGA